MRKQVPILFFTFILLFTFTGCFGQQDQEEVQEPETTTAIINGEPVEILLPPIDEEVEEEDRDPLAPDINVTEYNDILDQETYDIDECDKLDDERLQELCMNEAYTRKAIAENDPSLCDKVTRESERNTCLNKVEEFNEEQGIIDLQ